MAAFKMIKSISDDYFWFDALIFFLLLSPPTVLKMCRDKVTRKFVQPKTSILDPKGVYVIKIKDKEKIDEVGFQENDSNLTSLYIWKGIVILP